MSTNETIFDPYTLGNITLQNRIVMSPLTRSRSTADHIPTPIMAAYYGERATAGLIISEGTAPSPNGAGYPRIPGIYNDEQVKHWKVATDAVHTNGGKIFLQMMHCGRVSHPGNMAEGTTIFAPSAIQPKETKMYVDGKGDQEIPTPTAMEASDINHVIKEYNIQVKYFGKILHSIVHAYICLTHPSGSCCTCTHILVQYFHKILNLHSVFP